jgi:hypothetical protein
MWIESDKETGTDDAMLQLIRLLIKKGADDELIQDILSELETDENFHKMIEEVTPLEMSSRTDLLEKAIAIANPEEGQWPQLPDDNPYRIHLIKLLHSITDQVPMEMPDIVLIMLHLNTEDRIVRFADWVLSKLDGNHLNATAREICRAATWIYDGRTDLP